MNMYTRDALFDELEKIDKEAGVGSFLAKGFKSLGSTAKNIGRKGALKGHGSNIKGLYQAGAKGKGGVWGGVKRVAGSPYGQMGAAAGTAGLAGYGGYKALGG